ncbi:hypothetical protein SCLCIDRAFT_279680 [Scleroderma citrinum Foug A]|uniref:Uncharacterized protein n=1 Tax=Scleroderma citrinum Foug A TaxID=1036808 RepID=A0A0C2ZTV1_9AGAM|nr:hypothetical protein SCLCIDRAFT_279680 [Scleroderma citrinum Foug A]
MKQASPWITSTSPDATGTQIRCGVSYSAYVLCLTVKTLEQAVTPRTMSCKTSPLRKLITVVGTVRAKSVSMYWAAWPSIENLNDCRCCRQDI